MAYDFGRLSLGLGLRGGVAFERQTFDPGMRTAPARSSFGPMLQGVFRAEVDLWRAVFAAAEMSGAVVAAPDGESGFSFSMDGMGSAGLGLGLRY